MNSKLFFAIFFFVLLYLNIANSSENKINVAVSSNFLTTFKKISQKFKKKHNCEIVISSDSTTNLFTKIKNGAPFDVFISADAKHPTLLKNFLLIKDNTYTYAYGMITLWAKKTHLKKNSLIHFRNIKNITLANPRLSPYGYASKETYLNLKIKNKNFIFASNINQAFNFIYSENSEIGIVALSQIIHKQIKKINTWNIPSYLYPKIEQQLILLKNNKKNNLQKKLIKYIKTKKIKKIIKKCGYKLKNE